MINYMEQHYNKLIGRTITAIIKDPPSVETTYYGLQLDNGDIGWIQCDPEGNGPGFLNLQVNEGAPREVELEHNRWTLFCEEAQAVGIDPNKSQFNGLFRAAACWGESLAALRLIQTPEQRAKAMSMANARYTNRSNK